MEEYDVLVVGGGPIGAAVAHDCAESGHSVALFEENTTIGLPLHCAGLVTERAFKIPGLPRDGLVLNTITGAEIHSPSGQVLTIGGDRAHALVIDRVKYDQALVKKAVDASAVLHTGEKITEAGQTSEDVWISNPQFSARGKILVGADGARSVVRSLFDFPSPFEYLEGIGAEVTCVSLEPQRVLLYTGRQIAPGFFAWIIPVNEKGTMARVGLCKIQKSSASLQDCFKTLMAVPPLAGAEVTARYGGLVPLGVVEPTVKSRVLLVGDAAAQVKPTSGGGIVTGLMAARTCAAVINQALKGSSLSLSPLARYPSCWKRAFGREVSLGMAFRSYYREMPDEKIDKWFTDLQKPGVIAAISKAGDLDYPSRLLLPLLRAAPWLAVRLPGMLLSRSQHQRLRDEGGAGGT